MKVPPDLKYTESHEWIRVDGTLGTAGITDYAQDQLSDIVFVEVTASIGDAVAQGEAAATVESVKAAADVYMPVAGTITEINDTLPDRPEVVNADPYGEAWMIRFEISDPNEIEGLMDAAAYEKFCEERSQ